MISVSVLHRQGEFVLDAHFEAGGGVTALFGPSGSGKTTLVQMIAGLTRPDEARISFERLLARLDEFRLVDPSALSYAPSFLIRGLNDLPLRFRRRA